jgi:aryl-alcohol dehydrogenase-like predicted oxidoreductase
MPLDHYVTLGRSGLRVSPLCLGAMIRVRGVR